MKDSSFHIYRILLWGCYVYLALPVILFVLFWYQWFIGIPVALLVAVGCFLCVRAYGAEGAGMRDFLSVCRANGVKIFCVLMVVMLWVVLSGVGGYVWQNSDHHVRNEIFRVLVENPWPVYSNTAERVPLSYYIGFWLPAAGIGKVWGLRLGYAVQVVWAVMGIVLCYALVCVKRRKVSVWPLMLLIFFSGLDVIGTALVQEGEGQIFGTVHLEAWSWYFQFSSMTTQLFWVFNQAIPAWLACALVFFFEKPRNMLFTLSMLLLTSSFPFVGLLPFAVYFCIRRSQWRNPGSGLRELLGDMRRSWFSVQNAAGVLVCLFCGLYLIGNEALSGTVSFLYTKEGEFDLWILLFGGCAAVVFFLGTSWLVVRGKSGLLKGLGLLLALAFVCWQLPGFREVEWWTTPFVWVILTTFYWIEAGLFLAVLYPTVSEKGLFWLNAIWLYLIPLIRVGYSCDFCMRASIPGLLLIAFWSIEALENFKSIIRSGKGITVALLVVLLVVGAVTPLHEFKRTLVNSAVFYERYAVSEEVLYQGPNVRGNSNSFFWKYLAR